MKEQRKGGDQKLAKNKKKKRKCQIGEENEKMEEREIEQKYQKQDMQKK